MQSNRYRLAAVILALVPVLMALAGPGQVRAAEPPSCTGREMNFVAHEDDDLIFLSPRLRAEIDSDRCIRTVFLTAGDDGQPRTYWNGREEGVEAAYSEMLGVANAWSQSTVESDGHVLVLKTLTAEPRISVVFMRLPDGGYPQGTGTERYGFQSLMKLWNGGNPCNGCAEESSITAVDGSNTYSYTGLISTLADLMAGYGPRQIFTQNFEEAFFNGDHPDHVATGRFTKAAAAQYPGAYRLTGFVGYNTENRPANVSGEYLARKSQAFYAYGAHDPEVCDSLVACAGGPYEVWLARQYVAGRETSGVVADAGFGQEVGAGAKVVLDGGGSSDAGGEPLTYEWTQTGGPTVSLANPTAAKPTFTMVSHPTLLTFALTVSAGGTTSSPDYAQVRVPATDPTPTAIAGEAQTVATDSTVLLDGSESWDPNSLPLEYEWEQTAGPPVTLAGAETATPSFVAPLGPTTVTLSLSVSNGAETSVSSSVAITVLGVAPSFVSAGSATLVAGTSSVFAFVVEGSPLPELILAGAAPPGLTFFDEGDGTATLSGTVPTSVAPPGKTRTYPLIVEAVNEYGEVEQSFSLDVAVPAEDPIPSLEPSPRPQPAAPPPPAGIAPAFISPSVVYGYVGKRLDVSIAASGTPAPDVSLVGRLPEGLAFRAMEAGTARLVGKALVTTTYRFALAADSSAGSAAQRLRVAVDPLPRLSRSTVRLPAGRATRRVVRVEGKGITSVRYLGGRPPGVRCVVKGNQVSVFGSTAARSGRVYRLRLEATGRAGTVQFFLDVQTSA
jgi:hypothetical protein